MSYINQITFCIEEDQMSEIELGHSLERVLGYMRTLLPSQEGFIASRAMHTLPDEGKIYLLFRKKNYWIALILPWDLL